MLKIVTEGDLRYLLGVILILYWLGKTYADERQKLIGGFIAIVAFLAFVAFAVERFGPRDAEALFNISVRALVTFGLSLGMSWIMLALIAAIVRPPWEMIRRSQARARERRREQEAREQAFRPEPPEPPPLPPLPPPLPPPTTEELMAAAQERYETALRLLATANLDEIELQSARARAKQKYLRELDDTMK